MTTAQTGQRKPETVKVLLDLGVKRHDLAERSFDVANTRLAALFAFNSFMVPAGIAALREVMSARWGLTDDGRSGLLALWSTALLVTAVACIAGFMARPVKSLPDAVALFRDGADKDLVEVAPDIFASMERAWVTLAEALSFKARCVNVGLAGVGSQVVTLLAAFLRTTG